ncbi:LysR family transcriptional regulator [Rhizobium sp. A37_96]
MHKDLNENRCCDKPSNAGRHDDENCTMEELGFRTLMVTSAVAAHRSFRGAATELNMSPSSVSHIVANLERRVGIRLFLRNTRSVSLTEAGEAFLARIRPALAEINGALDGIHELRDRPAGLVRVNVSSWGGG